MTKVHLFKGVALLAIIIASVSSGATAPSTSDTTTATTTSDTSTATSTSDTTTTTSTSDITTATSTSDRTTATSTSDTSTVSSISQSVSTVASTQSTSLMTFTFDCRRNGADCPNGDYCQLTDGKCNCTDAANFTCKDYKGIAKVTSFSNCTNECGPHGICVTNDTCECDEDYYGDKCEIKRVDLYCSGHEMFIVINPNVQDFKGSISLLQNESCTLSGSFQTPSFIQNSSFSDWSGYSIVLPHNDSNCGQVTHQTLTDANKTVYTRYSRQFLIQYIPNVKSSLDQVITANCDMYNSTSVSSYVSEKWKSSFSGLSNNTVTKETNGHVVLSVLDEHNKSVREVYLGKEIQLEFTFPQNEINAYDDLKVTSCEAIEISSKSSINILENECPAIQSKALFYHEINFHIGNTTIYLRAFHFDKALLHKQIIEFVCNVSFCMDQCDHIKQTDCSKSVTAGHTVRRRAAVSGDQEQVSTVVTVLDPSAEIQEIKEQMQSSDCLQQPSFIAVIATMGGVLLILLIVCIVVTLRLIKANKKKPEDWKYQLTHLPRVSIGLSGH